MRVKDAFLAIDQTAKFDYVLNIIDMGGKMSYTRVTLLNQGDFQLYIKECSLRFTGLPRTGQKYRPGYVFRLRTAEDYHNLRGILTKCFFEVNNKLEFEKNLGEGDD